MSEAQIFEQLQPLFLRASELFHLDPDGFRREELKEFSSIYFDKTLLFRVRSRGKNDNISFAPALSEQISDRLLPYTVSRDDLIHVPLGEGYDSDLDSVILAAIEDMVDHVSKEYDSCAFVDACSDAGKCVREDDRTRSLYCGYRKILKSGRVFFGAKKGET